MADLKYGIPHFDSYHGIRFALLSLHIMCHMTGSKKEISCGIQVYYSTNRLLSAPFLYVSAYPRLSAELFLPFYHPTC